MSCEHDWKYVRRVRIWQAVPVPQIIGPLAGSGELGDGRRVSRYEYRCRLCGRTSFTKDRRPII